MNFRTRKNEDVRMFVKIVVSHDERSKNQQKKKTVSNARRPKFVISDIHLDKLHKIPITINNPTRAHCNKTENYRNSDSRKLATPHGPIGLRLGN